MADTANGDPTQDLFAQYKEELRALYQKQLEERGRVVRQIMDENGVDEATAGEMETAENGPLIHDPRVIHLIRKYWLAVDHLKKQSQGTGRGWVEPLTFLVEYLAEDDDGQDLVEYLTQIAYWPVGIDENGDWS